MKRTMKLSTTFMGVVALIASAFVILATSGMLAPCCFADDEFQDLVNKIPRSANAVVILNMEKAKSSPMGVKEDWNSKVEQAFESGLTRVPPQAKRFVLASQIDFEFMQPMWEAAVIDLEQDLSSSAIEKARHGTLDTIEGLPAVCRPNDTYILKFAPRLVGAMGPANRQAVVRWIRDVRKPSPPPLSPYLQKAAVYSDKAGSDIIIAIDLDGVFSLERIGKYLKSKSKRLQEWGADLTQLARLLNSVQGVRIGVRIGEEPSGMAVIDVQGDASIVAPYAKELFVQIMSDRGMSINEVSSWTAKAEGNEISLAGKLSKNGLRRLLSVIDSPETGTPDSDPPISPSELPAFQAKKSLDYFRTVVGMADDLKEGLRNVKNLASTQLYFDKYARRIERMPILNVDEDLVNWGAFVANSLRQATSSVKTMGIQSGVRQAGVTSGSVDGGDYGYGGGYRYGAYGAYNGGADIYGMGDVKAVGEQRRVIRAEEKATAATDIQQVRQNMIAATADIRRKMTQKYQMEF
jgi:hypothetical protein